MKNSPWIRVLATVALPVALAFVLLPSTAAAKAECDCSDLKALQLELRIAKQLQQNFLNKIPELKTMGKELSNANFQKFTQGEVLKGVESIPDYKGPATVDYDSWGRANLAAADNPKFDAEKLCGMTLSAIAVLNAAIAASACPAIGEALRAHEEVHLNFCKRIGFKPYEAMHGADRAREEAEAYGAQIKVLQDTIAKLRCGYRVNEQFGPAKWSGVICSLEQPFTLNGSHPVVKFTLEFTPSSVTSGTWSLKTKIAVAGPVSAFGSGTYSVEGANTETPRLVLAGSSTATVPGYSATRSQDPGNFKLIPLDTGECSQP